MGVFARDKNQLSYIYNSNSNLGEKVLGYVKGMEFQIDTIDISKDNLGDTAWTEISELLGMGFDEILATDHPEVPEKFQGGSFDTKGWLKILNQNPIMLQNPIAINGDRAKQIESRDDILKFYGVDSAGLEQSPDEGRPDTKSNTENETFIPDRD
ncbi:arsenate reductase family protein [Costertonia aggregata]|uniref:Arsenate reductase n=1 Tax=Costertonia aggregata TaxID=343403 RepID=A0A7H9ASV1_9FLAO|nr:hypothetical protein [Costertonia aggregata]QLG46487.1 hypothetical protein HYG79_14405 [Costertonia aggregata]